MTIAIAHLRSHFDSYLDKHPGEQARLAGLAELLATDQALTDRANMKGHCTATAVIVNPAGRILLVHHRFYRVWWPPGGHLEHGDATLAEAALREAAEETGIDPASVVQAESAPLHIDITEVAANEAKGEGAHRHFDFRYLFASDHVALRHQEAEVHQAAWRPLSDLDAPTLTARMRDRAPWPAATQ